MSITMHQSCAATHPWNWINQSESSKVNTQVMKPFGLEKRKRGKRGGRQVRERAQAALEKKQQMRQMREKELLTAFNNSGANNSAFNPDLKTPVLLRCVNPNGMPRCVDWNGTVARVTVKFSNFEQRSLCVNTSDENNQTNNLMQQICGVAFNIEANPTLIGGEAAFPYSIVVEERKVNQDFTGCDWEVVRECDLTTGEKREMRENQVAEQSAPSSPVSCTSRTSTNSDSSFFLVSL